MKYMVTSCGYCGACVTVCPNKLLELTEHKLIVHKGCTNCGNCVVVCPLGAILEDDS